jgi:hypothetical protein
MIRPAQKFFKTFFIAIGIFTLMNFAVLQKAEARKEIKASGRTEQNTDEDGNSQTRQPFKEATNGMDMRKMRRVAIGVQAAGNLGFGGALLELNFSPSWGFVAGIGGGEGFQTYEIGAKYVLGGEKFLPYLALDYAHWATINKTGYIERTNPSIVGDHLLTADERATGGFQKNLLIPGFGMQYVQLDGEWAGSSVFAELNILMDIGDFLVAPTGTIGFLYYF